MKVRREGERRETQPRRGHDAQVAGGGDANVLCTYGVSSSRRETPHYQVYPPLLNLLLPPRRPLKQAEGQQGECFGKSG